jgi:hypothetical protein
LWWFGLVVAGHDPGLPPELLSKIRLFESVLPLLCRLAGLRDVRTLADLLPSDDEEATNLLQLLHRWSGEMLVEPPEPAPGGTPGAGSDGERPAVEEKHGTDSPV